MAGQRTFILLHWGVEHEGWEASQRAEGFFERGTIDVMTFTPRGSFQPKRKGGREGEV